MADRHFVASPALRDPRVKTDGCPRVAELIDYALGHSSGDDRQRIDRHLTHEDCSACRGWVEQAKRFRAELPPPASPSARGSASPSVSDPTPIPASSKFQRQALRDLEERLRTLDSQ